MSSQDNEFAALRQELRDGFGRVEARLDKIDMRLDGIDGHLDTFSDALVFVARKVLAPSEIVELKAILGGQAGRARKLG